MDLRRTRVIGPVLLALALSGTAACTSSQGAEDPSPPSAAPQAGSSDEPEVPQVPRAVAAAPGSPTVLDGRDAVALAIQASQAVWQRSPVVVSAPEQDAEALTRAADLAATLGVPLLMLPAPPAGSEPSSAAPLPAASASSASPPAPASTPSASGSAPPAPEVARAIAQVEAELGRLGATHVLHTGPDLPQLAGVAVVSERAELPEFVGAAPADGLTALTARRAAPAGEAAGALASLAAAGATSVRLASTDPRVDPDDVDALAGVDPAAVVGVGRRFGDEATFGARVEAAATGVQLPGGGQTIFDGKRYVALYGHPLTGALGVLGEQGPTGSVTRARRVAAEYEQLTDETIVPAFEIIATVASGSAGKDGDYSNEWDVDVLRPLVDAAAEAGIYVVLDLQSGREDFLSQAKLYEELLLEPHVGLAMDPEWRLTATQKPLRQIGSVSAAELNEAIDWLAALTEANDLPQKMVLLHQFRTSMITDRADLHLDHDELAVIVQMDGDGTLGQKLDTWNALRVGAPKALRFGWKNFYDEDEPTPSPATTFRVQPTPWWVSYQ